MLANNADITILSPTLSHGFPFLLTVLHSHWPLKTVRIGLVFVSLWTLNSLFSAWLLVQQASFHPFISTYIVTFRLHQSVPLQLLISVIKLCFFISLGIWNYFIYLIVYQIYSTFYPAELGSKRQRAFALSYSLLYPICLEQYHAHRSSLANIYWTN